MAQVSTNFWGVVVELDDEETKKVVERRSHGGGAGAGGIIPVACAATGIAAPICAAVVAGVAGYAAAMSWLIRQVNVGYGVYLTLPWVALWSGQIYAIIPTTRPSPAPGPIQPGWAAGQRRPVRHQRPGRHHRLPDRPRCHWSRRRRVRSCDRPRLFGLGQSPVHARRGGQRVGDQGDGGSWW